MNCIETDYERNYIMTLIETHEYRFPSHLLPALINNDLVIDSEDRDHFEAFIKELEQLKKKYNAEYYMVDCNSDSYYAKKNCLYGNLGCDVTDIKVYFIS